MPPLFHRGELEAQSLAGTRGVAEELSAGLATTLPAAGLESLLSPLRLLVFSSVSPSGSVWVSLAFGPEGFVRAPTPTDLQVDLAGLPSNDVLRENLSRHTSNSEHAVGVLAIDFARRRRYRTNGTANFISKGQSSQTIHLRVKEAFPNCPKYIQARSVTQETSHLPPIPAISSDENTSTTTASSTALTASDRSIIERSDTIFFGTHNAPTGADVNHRGGLPGFVRVMSDTELYWPDYRGNGMFQSFGNLQEDDRAGLAFLDFDTGKVLQLSGRATVSWKIDPAVDPPVESGAMRLVRFRIEQVRRSVTPATNYRWGVPQYSPYNPALTSGENDLTSGGFPMKVRLVKVVPESPVVKTFRFLAPRRIGFLPGQYATLDFGPMPALGTGDESIVRTWTLSEAANSTDGDLTLEVSVKRKKGGLMSNWLHDHAEVGLEVMLLGVGGEMSPFILDELPSKYLLVSGGIGITPYMAILRGLGARLGKEESEALDVIVLHQESIQEQIPFKKELYRRARTSNGQVKLVTVISRERDANDGEEASDGVTVVDGRIGLNLLKEIVKDIAERTIYLCGPTAFMSSISDNLIASGASPESIVTEEFNF